MFRPTQCMQGRLRLTTKQIGPGYYKGNRTGSMGHFGRKKGIYIIDWEKVRTYVVPEGLAEFKLTPFVTKRMEPTRTLYTKTIDHGDKEATYPRGYTGKDFLKEWTEENDAEVDELRLRQEEINAEEPTETQTTKSEKEYTRGQPSAEARWPRDQAVVWTAHCLTSLPTHDAISLTELYGVNSRNSTPYLDASKAMFPAFTGSTRRPRQVNLSTRSTNLFSGASPKRQHPSGHGSQATLAIAQHERAQRQLERDRLNSSQTIQRTWRGYRSRKITWSIWREEWDEHERARGIGYRPAAEIQGTAYSSSLECAKQLRLLLQFIQTTSQEDAARLGYFSKCLQRTVETTSLSTEGEWTAILSRLMMVALDILKATSRSNSISYSIDDLLQLLVFLTRLIPKQMARQARKYYDVMAKLTLDSSTTNFTRDRLVEAILALLQPITSETLVVYEWFARTYLTIPFLQDHLGTINDLAAQVNYKLLASVISTNILPSQSFTHAEQVEPRIWLLAYFIYFHRHALGGQAINQTPEVLFVKVVSLLLSSAATYISQRLDLDDFRDSQPSQELKPLPPFVRSEILTLINQNSITHLLSLAGKGEVVGNDIQQTGEDDAKSLATYALTLLRIFPKRGDEIRMWLYLGSASIYEDTTSTASKLPAIKYFWYAARTTEVYLNVSKNPHGVLAMLLPPGNDENEQVQQRWNDQEQQWTVILIFLELYTFLLKVLDDDEFFSGASTNKYTSWTKESALALEDIKELTIFLTNLAFTLYWNSSELTAAETDKTFEMRDYFSVSGPREIIPPAPRKPQSKDLGGATGIPLHYFKGLVTGLLRMIHERDSRRRFLPDGHWLMTNRFDMTGFIPAVVAEEENRHQLQDDDDESEPEDEAIEDALQSSLGLVGTGREQNLRRMEILRRRQLQASRRKELEAVAPRLEILRNMPFSIPFTTRVQIFREFIYRDQIRRRNGYVDPDSWRLSIAQGATSLNDDGFGARDLLSKHHANIRRESVFRDAFESFYSLGEAFKEPIQITFIDKFDTIEAGIDGGGVAKEFLTSVISDAFNPTEFRSMFVENDEHLLYPNPSSIEQLKSHLRAIGVAERSTHWNEHIRDVLQEYEFLGRIIGKCLYEGILVDVSFAGFFLLKWALTGGAGSASRESSYRANLNDVQDLDKGLYQGLLQLKNYPGNVEDFALNFTVTDTVRVLDYEGGYKTETITRELKPGGSNIPVTNQNRLVYISYIARHRLQLQPYLQTNAFLQGLGQIIQPSWLSMFNQGELQRLVGGDAIEIDVDDLRRNTVYSGVYVLGDDQQDHPTIKIFWEVLKAMPNEDRQKVLKFVTSTPRAPLLGFSHLNPRFSIRDSSSDEERLPSASTCANLLKLPRYSNAHTLREKLMYAVNSGAGFDLS
ncbi:IQ and HECT domain-containing protein [Arthroderma uncinatum]|uniref:IQ and HECT domain-containing protein n=1 Tax=Arthroderma uncinatum TaxID=74035 RepID=UPI00144AF0F3|nr:IQ and HECT domain-containing protein [Arthroderma uncinatum]KAF3482961.1 IQ and HECT domain-containing protein [Arthroderma uncinatum]